MANGAEESCMNQQALSFLRGWNLVNRRGGAPSVQAVVVLLGFCALAHFMAQLKMHLAHMFALMDDRTMHEMSIIHFIHTHPWVAVFYGGILLTSIIWLESRSGPQWTVWLTFGLFAVPCLVYAWACLHISNKILTVPS